MRQSSLKMYRNTYFIKTKKPHITAWLREKCTNPIIIFPQMAFNLFLPDPMALQLFRTFHLTPAPYLHTEQKVRKKFLHILQ